MPADEQSRLRYRVIARPSDLQRAAFKGMQAAVAALLRDGSRVAVRGRPASFAEREQGVNLENWTGPNC